MNRKTRNTVLFVVLIFAAAAGTMALRAFTGRQGAYAAVQSHGKEIARLPLNTDAKLPVGNARTGYNLVRVADGAVSVERADCPNQICVREGEKRYAGETIACLPHKLIITVKQESPQQDALVP